MNNGGMPRLSSASRACHGSLTHSLMTIYRGSSLRNSPMMSRLSPKRRRPDPATRNFKIIKGDPINLGYTTHCPECYSARNLTSHKPHKPVCRERLRAAMLSDEQYAQRIKNATGRQDSWLECRVMECAEAAEKDNLMKNDGTNNEPDNCAMTDVQKQDRQDMADEKSLSTDGLYKEVNDDLERRLANIPDDDDDDESIQGILNGEIRAHVAEAYSPPRVIARAARFGLAPGFAMDLLTSDEAGKPWTFDDPEQSRKYKAKLWKDKPYLLIGSPMCTVFSIIQNLNFEKLGPVKWRKMWAYGMRHLLFTFELFEIQLSEGRYILHEHPLTATSWYVPEVLQFTQRHGFVRVVRDMCMHGVIADSRDGPAPAKKPTGFLTNSEYIRDAVSIQCHGDHQHVQPMGGKASKDKVYPNGPCDAMLGGLRRQLTVDGVLTDQASMLHLMTDNTREVLEIIHDVDEEPFYDGEG